MPAIIKNCGLKTPEAIDQAIATGAGFVGFVHHKSSPRHVTLEEMRLLVDHAKPRIRTVAVLVSPAASLLKAVMSAKPDYVQIHDVDSPYRIDEIKALCGVPVITAVAIDNASNFNHAKFLAIPSDFLLFDTRNSGSGQTFDWRLLDSHVFSKPWFLAGGLTANNVAEAISITGAPMVDVSSGIEDAPGNKSLEKIAAFNTAVLEGGTQ